MAERLGDAVLALRTDDTAFSRGVDRAKRKAESLERTLNKVGKSAVRMGKTLSLSVSLPIIAIGAAAVKTASDIQEMRNLFRETFEGASDDVEAWAAATAQATNRSRFELMRTAADFAAFLKPLGTAPENIVPMSKALTQLTTDIASFRNQTEEEVFTRLFSGLAGETEAVRRLGIDIGAAAVEQELLRQGIKKTQAEASQAEKVMARFALIIRQTADAQGDAARTAGSFENQSKALGATIKDVRAEIGARLLPVATRMVQELRSLGQRFLELSQNAQSGIIAIVTFAAVIGPALIAVGLLLQALSFAFGGFRSLGTIAVLVGKVIKGVLIGIQAAVVGFLGFFATIPGIIITTLAAVLGAFFIFKDTLIGFFKGLIIALKNEFIAAFNNKIVIPFQESINALVNFLPDSVIEMMGISPLKVNEVIENDFGRQMSQVIAEATENAERELNEFKTVAGNALDFVKTKFGQIKGAAAGIIPEFEAADFSLENIGAKFQGLLDQLNAINAGVAGVGDTAGEAASKGAKAFNELGLAISTSVEDGLTDALSGIRSFADAARSILSSVLQGIVRLGIVRPILGAIGLPLPGLAEGGRVGAGQAAIVGEEGPEAVVFDRAGTVIPNDQIGGMGGGIRQEFNFPLTFPAQLEAFVRNVAGPAGREAALNILQAQRGRI